MAEKIRFFKGTQAKYNALQDKKSNYIYVITDTPAIYLGTTELTSGTDLSGALSRIVSIESALDGIDLTSEGSVRETIDDVLEYLEGVIGDLDDLDTTADSSIVAAINENKSRIDSSSISISVAGSPTAGYLKTYIVSQGNTEVGKIDIPKDLVISSGSLVEATPQNPIDGHASGTFLDLVIANQSAHLYINLSDLIDVYTAQPNATQVQLSVTNGVISASIVGGSIGSTELASNAVTTDKILNKNVTTAKLEQSVQTTLSSASTHMSDTSNPHSVTYSQVGAAAASHNHSATDITSGTLSASRGGTGETSLQNAANSMIKALSIGTNDPVDGDYIVTQYAGGGTSTETYHRRSITTLYNYMKSKLSSDFAALSHGNHVPVYSTSQNNKVLKVVDGTPIWSEDNNTTYTFAEGSTNGTFSVTPSGGSATNIAIKGLGSAAYTNSSAYAASGHVHTLTLATDTGSSSVTLEADTKYKLTAGGSTLIFTTPAHQSLTNYSTISHTHTLTLASDTGTSNITLAFGSKYKLTAGGNSVIFTMPSNPDTNTTYGFSGGTNKFTVTPSVGDAYDVTVTPSISNNVTGSGTSGYIAKFNGTNTITSGPQLGSSTTTFLRNDGTWATPTDTDSKVNVVTRGTTKAYLLGTTTSPTSTAIGVTAVAETGVYFDTETATLVASTFKGSLTGTASGNLTSSSDLAWSKVTGRPTTLSGYGITDAASSSHTHTLSIGTDNGTNALTLAFGTKYKLTAGGSTFIFTMPSNPNTNTTYTFEEGSTDGAFSVTPSNGSATSVSIHGLGSAAYTASTSYAAASHTHILTLASDTGTSSVTLASAGKYKLTAGGNSVIFTMPTIPTVSYPVTSVNSKTGAVTLTYSDVGAAESGHSHAFSAITSKPTTLSGYGITDAASSTHTHDITLATDTGTSSITLASAGKYKLTAGGKSVIFTMPTIPSVSYPVTSVAGKTGDVTLSSSDVGLGNVGNFKAVSTVASQGLTSTEQSNARANIGAGTSSLTLGTTESTAAKGNHTHSASDVGAIATTAKGAANGVAELGSDGKVPSAQLPSFVDDVLEYTAKSSFPSTGETGKIYVDTTTNLTYRWSGSAYVEISASLALGETSSTAYRGDRGKIAYDHSQATHARTDATAVSASSTNGNIKINGTETTVYTHPSGTNPHGTTASDVGLGNVGNFKAVSTVASQGLTDTEKSNARANIGAGTSSLTIGTSSTTAAAGNHTHTTSLATDTGTSTITLTSGGKYKLTAGGTSVIFTMPTFNNYSHPTYSAADAAAKKIGRDSTGHVVIGDAITASDVGAASSSHSHTFASLTSKPTTLSGFGITDAASSGHTHTLTLATDTGTSNVTLTSGGKFKLTAGGNSIVFTMPTSNNYSHPTYDTASAAAVKVGRDSTGHVVIGEALTASDVGASASGHTHTFASLTSKPTTLSGFGITDAASSSHTHTTSLASDTGTSTVTLTSGGKYKLTAGGTSVIFTMPTSNNYSHPTYTATTAAAKKIGCDSTGHVVIGETITASDVGAATSGHTHTLSLASGGTSSLDLAASTTYTLTAGGNTYAFKTAPNTTYSSKTAASGGTDVSLVTTGEKYTWNNKSNLTIGTSSTTAAAGNHTHTVTIAADSGTNALSMEANTKYKLTAGGSTFIFTTPAHQSLSGYATTSHAHTVTIAADNGTNALTMEANTKYKLTAGGSTFIFTTPAHQSLSGYSTTSHTHTTTLAADSGTSSVTLAFGSKYKLTAGGTSVIFTMPSISDSDTKNTAGSTDTSSKIFLIGATSQAANPQTYSHDTAYVGTDGCLYSGGAKVLTSHQDISGKIDTAGSGLSKSGTTLNHSNSVTAKTTQSVYPITFDAQGHITGCGTAITPAVITETSVTIGTSSWDSTTLQATATVSGVTSSSKIWVGPAESTYDVFVEAGIRGIAQSTNSVTFKCTTVPTASVTINVAVAN